MLHFMVLSVFESMFFCFVKVFGGKQQKTLCRKFLAICFVEKSYKFLFFLLL